MRKLLPILCTVIAGAGAMIWWLHGAKTAALPARPGVLLISGDTAGWITPCGCTANQSGGLLRRGTYVQELRKSAEVIYADVGGAPAGVSPYQRVKFEAVLSGERAMGISAHNIGGPEAALGAAYLREAGARLKVSFISANARDRAGQALAAPMQIAEAHGRRVALIGVLSPRYATADVHVDDPKQAVLNALAEGKGKYDCAVVLAYLPEEELSQLAADLPEVDAVVGGPTGQALAPRSVGPSLLAAATNKGKFLVQLDLPAAGASGRLGGKVAEMGPSIPDQDAQLANLRQYLATVGERDFSAVESGLTPPLPSDPPADYRVAGSESCAACHRAENDSWAHSGHGHAWQTLQPRGFHVDPYCLQCHTTGYGQAGGFVSVRRSAALVGVGCENCHGPSQAHVHDPKVRTPFVALDQCVRCHDHENSPNFARDAFWAKIRHGKAAADRTTPGRAGGGRAQLEVQP